MAIKIIEHKHERKKIRYEQRLVARKEAKNVLQIVSDANEG